MAKISDRTPETDFDDADNFVFSDSSEGVDKRITGADLKEKIAGYTVEGGDAGKQLFINPDSDGVEKLTYNPLFGKDYFQILSNNLPKGKIYVKPTDNRVFDILIPTGQGGAGKFAMEKDPNDDFIRLTKVSKTSLSEAEGYKRKPQNAQDYNGNINDSSSPNYYAQDVGDTIKFTFKGTGVAFRYPTDDRGGLWEFVVDGYDAGAVEVSTYDSGAFDTLNETTLFSGLPEGTHTVIGTFQGDDPANAPSGGAGTSRGWFHYQESGEDILFRTFWGFDNFKQDTEDFDITFLNSNIEFALSVRQDGSSNDYEWLPQHSTVGTMTNTEERVYFDDELIDFDAYADPAYANEEYQPVDSVRIEQVSTGENPNDGVDIAEITTIHHFTNEGLSISVEIEFLVNTDIEKGYVGMIPADDGHGTKIIDNFGNSIDLGIYDGSQEFFPYRDYLQSIAVINDSATADKNSTILGATFYDTKKSFLYNTNGYRSDGGEERRFWVEHRSGGDLNKMYPQTYFNDTINAGFRHSFAMALCVGKLNYKLFE